jgi:nitrite reductase (NO-forming)
MTFNRRDLFRLLGIGGATGAAGTVGFLGGQQGAENRGQAEEHSSGSVYGGNFTPPSGLGPRALDDLLIPPPAPTGTASKDVKIIDFKVIEQSLEIADGTFIDTWTYEGHAPGPVIRVVEGQELEVRLHNTAAHPHNIHFHGRHNIASDGWQPVAPGKTSVQKFSATPFGLYPYHCHVPPISEHVARGMYGVMIVDPPEARPPAQEFVLTLGAWSGPEGPVFAWNGIAGFFARFPIKVTAGQPVRIYLSNLVMTEPMASFHLHGEMFNIIRGGMGMVPVETSDVIMLGPTERAIIEFTLPERGRYMFHPHHIGMAERGAMGWFAAV